MISELGITLVTNNIITQVEDQLHKDMLSPNNLNNIPNCTVAGYDINFLKDPDADLATKEVMINLYDVYHDPGISNQVKQNLDSGTASTINQTQKNSMKTILLGQNVHLSEKDKKMIDLGVRKTLEYLLDNLVNHLHITVQHDTLNPNIHIVNITVDPVSLI